MAELREALTSEGFVDVGTYIQSGNVVLSVEARRERGLEAEVEVRVGGVASSVAGFDVPAVVRSAAEWRRMMASNPYPTTDPTKVHVLFASEGESMAAFDAFDVAKFSPEGMTVLGHDVFMHLPGGMGVSKLAVALARCKPATTARNWRTVLALAEML